VGYGIMRFFGFNKKKEIEEIALNFKKKLPNSKKFDE
jgi:hypothetical protein